MTQWLCRTLLVAIVATTTSGCTLYFDDDDDDCDDSAAEAFPGAGLRNPQTNQCEFFGGGGGGGCGDDLPLPAEGAADQAFQPEPNDWAACTTECEGLDETQCFAADRCRATYTQCPPGADCFRSFNGCVGIAPSGPVTGEACAGLDAYGCSRHNDCVAIYGTTDVPGDGYEGTGVFVGCDSEPTTLGCFSSTECPSGFQCTVDLGECLPPPGCEADGTCPAVCFGHCVPSGGSCAAVDCGPGFHCEEVCSGGDGPMPADEAPGVPIPPEECTVTCVPDVNFCPIECPPDSVCREVCPPCMYPGDPSCSGVCSYVCQPVGTGTCEGFDCGTDAHCEERCHPCDPLPDGTGCENACEPFCVPNGPAVCDATTCGPGERCEVQCTPSDPTDPMGPMTGCTATCVPDVNFGCAEVDCMPGFHCVETCMESVCMSPMGCPDVCRAECVSDGPGECDGVVWCDSIPPVCPSGTVPGVSGGCWTGYCIPDDVCETPPPVACEEETSEMACVGRPECQPLYTGTCTVNPDGTYTCTDTTFVRCETRVMPF